MKKLKNLVEQALDDSSNVQVVGLGNYPVGALKKNVEGKLDDLKRRIVSRSLDGVGPAQLELVCHMLLTLKAAEEGQNQGPQRTKLQVQESQPNKPQTPNNVVPFRKQK